MSLPTIAVVIPVHNGASTIARAIQSVLEQTYPASEIIVVDDGSTDETGRVVSAFGTSVKYLFQPNAGVSLARNNGAARATAEWLAFLDADDWYYPDRLKWHAEWIERQPDLDFLTGDYEYRRPDGSLISRSMEITEAGALLLRKAGGAREVVMGDDEMAMFVENHFGDTHTLSIRRCTFESLGGYPVGRAVCEDVDLLIRLCARSKRVGVICKPMAAYLIHPNSATRTDPLKAQRFTVETLLALAGAMRGAPTPVRKGLRGRLRRARLNLAYALVKRRRRVEAMTTVLTSLVDTPGIKTLRGFASIAIGCVQSGIKCDSELSPTDKEII